MLKNSDFKRFKRLLKVVIVLLCIITLTACKENTKPFSNTAEAWDYISSLYYVEHKKTDLPNGNKEVTITIADKNDNSKKYLFIYYNPSLLSRNAIIFYNYNTEIPVKRYYAVEPSKMYFDEKESYIEYKELLDKDYNAFLDEIYLNSNDLFDIAKWINETN